MKPKEARRVNVVEQSLKGTITVSQAAILLSLSERQVKRIKKGVKEQGLSYLAHKNRGRKPKHAISEETRKKVVELALNDYKNASCTHMAELLELHHNLSISPRSIRRILKQAGITNIHSHKAARCRRSRNRMPREGMLVQIDASPFNWLEERGPKLTCMVQSTMQPVRSWACISSRRSACWVYAPVKADGPKRHSSQAILQRPPHDLLLTQKR